MNDDNIMSYKAVMKKDLRDISDFIERFRAYSVKDEQAVIEISTMIQDVVIKIAKVEEAQNRRMALAKEIIKVLSELESDYRRFAEQYGKRSATTEVSGNNAAS
ncbi:MAG: hypothetical protein ACM3QV_00205 [Caulobacteraceae bacterium]